MDPAGHAQCIRAARFGRIQRGVGRLAGPSCSEAEVLLLKWPDHLLLERRGLLPES